MTQKKIRVYGKIPNTIDGTSFYRAMGVFPDLIDKLPHMEFIVNPQLIDWAMLGFADLMFLQRPYMDDHLQIVEMCRSNCVPVWVDYDDDLFRVPMSNPTFKQYSDKKIQENVAKIIAKADVVTVTTKFLKDHLSPLNKDIRIIPNALNDRKLNRRPALEPYTKKLINWRGSPTHQRDIAGVTTEIARLAHEHPDWTWNFIGESFWGLIEQMPKRNCVVTPPVDLTEYFHLIGTLQPAIQIVPLAENDFNRSKSNIGWIEGCYSGAVTVAPDWEEWKWPGIVNYKSRQEFYQKMKNLMTQPERLKPIALKGWKAIEENFLLSKINEKRVDLILEMTRERKPFVSVVLAESFREPPVVSSENSWKKPDSPDSSTPESSSPTSRPPLITSTDTPGLAPA